MIASRMNPPRHRSCREHGLPTAAVVRSSQPTPLYAAKVVTQRRHEQDLGAVAREICCRFKHMRLRPRRLLVMRPLLNAETNRASLDPDEQACKARRHAPCLQRPGPRRVHSERHDRCAAWLDGCPPGYAVALLRALNRPSPGASPQTPRPRAADPAPPSHPRPETDINDNIEAGNISS